MYFAFSISEDMKSKLTEKHLKALQMLEANQHSVPDVAKSVGFSPTYLNNLMAADPSTGPIGVLFHSEYIKIKTKIDDRITAKVNQTRDLLVARLFEWAQGLTKESVDTVSRHRMLVDSVNALSRAVPLVNIESTEWHTNLTGVNLVSEFKRLKAMAKATAVRERVSEAPTRGAGEISLPAEASDVAGEGIQDPQVRAKRKARPLS